MAKSFNEVQTVVERVEGILVALDQMQAKLRELNQGLGGAANVIKESAADLRTTWTESRMYTRPASAESKAYRDLIDRCERLREQLALQRV